MSYLSLSEKKSNNSEGLSVPNLKGYDLQGIKIVFKILSLTTYHGVWSPSSCDSYGLFNVKNRYVDIQRYKYRLIWAWNIDKDK